MIRMTMLGVAALALMAWGTDAMAVSCQSEVGVQALPVRTTPVPPLYSGMLGRPSALAAPHVLLAESRDESLALDVVLMRLRLEACAAQPVDEFANYVPKTEFDNTPYRFNMDKGKKFTAAEFDAWMKSRGVRVVKARPTGAAAVAVEAAVEVSAGTVSE